MKIKVFGLLMSMLISMFLVSTVAAEGTTVVYGKVESFTFKEYKDGALFLEESGKIYGIGVTSKFNPFRQLTLKVRGELFGGQVDYDGQTWGGVPVKTNTNYLGFEIEGDAGWKFMVAEKTSVEPFVGLGYRWWLRNLENAIAADGTAAIGYTENWRSLYARLGVRGDHNLSKHVRLFAEGGVRLPIQNKNTADLTVFGLNEVTVEPGNKASVFAEAGLQFRFLKASVFYEGMRFSESPAVLVGVDPILGAMHVLQPESKADMFGARVGITF